MSDIKKLKGRCFRWSDENGNIRESKVIDVDEKNKTVIIEPSDIFDHEENLSKMEKKILSIFKEDNKTVKDMHHKIRLKTLKSAISDMPDYTFIPAYAIGWRDKNKEKDDNC